jgi:hypothetical protein
LVAPVPRARGSGRPRAFAAAARSLDTPSPAAFWLAALAGGPAWPGARPSGAPPPLVSPPYMAAALPGPQLASRAAQTRRAPPARPALFSCILLPCRRAPASGPRPLAAPPGSAAPRAPSRRATPRPLPGAAPARPPAPPAPRHGRARADASAQARRRTHAGGALFGAPPLGALLYITCAPPLGPAPRRGPARPAPPAAPAGPAAGPAPAPARRPARSPSPPPIAPSVFCRGR